MQGNARGAALIFHWIFEHRPIVNLFATEHVPLFRKMDANLMRAACFQSAFHQRIVLQRFNGLDIRDGMFAWHGIDGRAASPTVTPVAHQSTINLHGLNDSAMHESFVNAEDGMLFELSTQMAFRFHRAGEDH